MTRFILTFAVAIGVATAPMLPTLAGEKKPSDMLGVPNEAYAHSQYMLHCQGCHLPDGAGFPERSIPRLTDFFGNFLAVEGGREFLVQVPGSSGAPVDDETLAQVLNWMLVTFSKEQLPKTYQPYTAEEVAELRKTPRIEVEKHRAELIKKISTQ